MQPMRKVVADWLHDQAVKNLGDLPSMPATSLVATQPDGTGVILAAVAAAAANASTGAGSAVHDTASSGDVGSTATGVDVTNGTSACHMGSHGAVFFFAFCLLACFVTHSETFRVFVLVHVACSAGWLVGWLPDS
jgi:hypothetical protein